MSRGITSIFGGLKQALLILDKLDRLSENIKKLTEKIDSMESRITRLEHNHELHTVRVENMTDNLKSAATVAVAQSYGPLIERVIHTETRLTILESSGPHDRKLLQDDIHRS